MNFASFLIALLTLAAGVAVGWTMARTRIDADTSGQAAATATIKAERDAAHGDCDRLRAERELMVGALRDADTKLATALAKLEALEQNEAQLKDTFARMSSEALQRNSANFLEMAEGRFKQAGVPMTDTLGKVELQLKEIEKERAGAQRTLSQQIEFVRTTGEALRTETASLVSALRKPQVRGQWGELQLRRCVEFAGMLDRCDFIEQASVTTADGVVRPDMVVNLVGGKTVVVDSKVTLVAYLEAHEAADDATRDEHLKRHARHLRQHVDSLATKSYWTQFAASPEFVIMFVPGDAPLNAALDQDPLLLEYAFAKRVFITGPMSLVPTLRTMAYAWQQESLASNAQEVFELGREMYKRLGVMGDHMDKLGRSLTGAVKAYNGTVGSLEKNVLATARKLNALEVVDTVLKAPKPVEEPVRTLGAAELVNAAEDARQVVMLPAAEDARQVVVLPAAEDATDVLALEARAADYGIDAAATRADPFGRRTGS